MTIDQDKSVRRGRQIWKSSIEGNIGQLIVLFLAVSKSIKSHGISTWISVFVLLLWVTRQILLKVDQRVASLASLAAVRRPASPTSLQIGVKLQWRNDVHLVQQQALIHSILFYDFSYECFLRHYILLEQEDRIPIREEAITRKKDQTAICSELQGTENGAGKELVSWF